MKFLIGVTAALSMLVAVGDGATTAAQAEQTYRWNVPLIWTPPHPVRLEQDDFVKRVSERTNGQLNISLFQFGELGLVDSDVLSIVRSGEFPLVELDHGKTSGDEPLFQIFNLPGLSFSIEDSMIIGEATEEIRTAALEEWNAVEIGMVHYMAPQGLFTQEAVRSVDDLSGMKIRVYSGVMLDSFNRLGAVPQLIPWGDTPAALLQELVDGAVTTPSSGINVGFGDTQNYMTVMPIGNRASWIMNKDVWESLSPEIQQIIREEAEVSGKRIQESWNAEEIAVAQEVEAAGMTFIPPSEEFKAEVAELLRPVWDEWAAQTEYGPEALERALEALGR